MTNSSRSGMDILISNTKKITEKCLMFCVKSVFISGLLYTTRTEMTCVFLKEFVYSFILIIGLSEVILYTKMIFI